MKANPGTDKATMWRSSVLRRALLWCSDGLLRVAQCSPAKRKVASTASGYEKRTVFWEFTICQALFLVKYITHLIYTATLWGAAMICLERFSPRHPHWLTSSPVSSLCSSTTFLMRLYPDGSLRNCNILLPLKIFIPITLLNVSFPQHIDPLLIHYI